MQVPIPPNAKILDYFQLSANDELFEFVSEQTNIYADQYKQANEGRSECARYRLLKPTTTDGIYNFFAIYLLSGIIQKPVVSLYSE